LTRDGTNFVGFSRDRDRLDAMLDSMVGRLEEEMVAWIPKYA